MEYEKPTIEKIELTETMVFLENSPIEIPDVPIW